jgi:hypothetical protein
MTGKIPAGERRNVSDDRTTDEQVQEAAEHADRAVEHREQAQRSSVEAQDPDSGTDAAALERESAEHLDAAEAEEADADEAAREADGD